MDYEILYQQYLVLEKALKDKSASMVKLQKTLVKEMDQGDLKSASKDLQTMLNVDAELALVLRQAQETIDGFDARAYLENGFFADQMLRLCAEHQVDVIGSFPNYEIFPFKIRFDVDSQDIYIDRKKVSCSRPESFVQSVKEAREKLMKVSFNAAQFASELANSYDLALLKLEKEHESDVYLQTLYKFLVPMSRFRKDYDQQSFAFDLARLYSAEPVELKDGRRFQFGHSRHSNKAIRILDNTGHEQYLATIRFFL